MHHSRSRPWSAKVAKLLPMVIILDVQTLPFDSEEVHVASTTKPAHGPSYSGDT